MRSSEHATIPALARYLLAEMDRLANPAKLRRRQAAVRLRAQAVPQPTSVGAAQRPVKKNPPRAVRPLQPALRLHPAAGDARRPPRAVLPARGEPPLLREHARVAREHRLRLRDGVDHRRPPVGLHGVAGAGVLRRPGAHRQAGGGQRVRAGGVRAAPAAREAPAARGQDAHLLAGSRDAGARRGAVRGGEVHLPVPPPVPGDGVHPARALRPALRPGPLRLTGRGSLRGGRDGVGAVQPQPARLLRPRGPRARPLGPLRGSRARSKNGDGRRLRLPRPAVRRARAQPVRRQARPDDHRPGRSQHPPAQGHREGSRRVLEEDQVAAPAGRVHPRGGRAARLRAAGRAPGAQPRGGSGTQQRQAEQLLANMDQLSDEQVAALLEQMSTDKGKG